MSSIPPIAQFLKAQHCCCCCCCSYTMENTASHSSCVSPAAETSMAESSWAMHIAEFLASSPHNNRHAMDRHQGGVSGSSFSYGFSSSFGDDDDSFITSELMCEDDNEEEDDSLKDTACSSAAGPKVTSMNDVDMKSMITMDAKETNTLQLAKYFVEVGSRQQTTDVAHQQVISGDKNNEKQLYECSDLRKKGLCLVPLSMLIDYLG